MASLKDEKKPIMTSFLEKETGINWSTAPSPAFVVDERLLKQI